MKEKPSTIYYNGNIHTMANKKDVYSAMAILNGKIMALGTDDEVISLKGKNTIVYDLKNHVVVPGLIETHTHIFRVGLSELHEEKFIPTSVKELLEYIKGKAKVIKPGEWIYFHNTYPTRIKEYRFPTLKELDDVAPNNPVYVDGAYAGQANSYALRILNIDENTPEPNDSKFIRDKQSGKLTGLLFRYSHIVRKAFGSGNHNIEDIKQGFLNIQANYHKLGITSVIDAMSSEDDIKALNELYEEGKLGLRTILTGLVSSVDSAEENLENLKTLLAIPPEWSKLCFCKVMVDGGILTGTSYMRKPYDDKSGIFGINFEDFRGIIQYNISQLLEFIHIAFKTGLQMTAHCIGDAAIDVLLDAYESYESCQTGNNINIYQKKNSIYHEEMNIYRKKNSIKNKRYSIIHCDFTDDYTLERIKNLNLSVLFQPAWHYMDGDILSKVLDSETMESFMPYKKFVDMNISASAGSDHMIKYDSMLSQNPYNPFISLYNMVTRKTRLGTIIGSENCISRYDALAMYTSKASYISFDEKNKGTLEVGKNADFAVLSHDYFNCHKEEIKNISSIITVVDGNVVN